VFTFYIYSYQINQYFFDNYENVCYGAWHYLGLSMLIVIDTDITKVLKRLKTVLDMMLCSLVDGYQYLGTYCHLQG
jgi:hypothetical protein